MCADCNFLFLVCHRLSLPIKNLILWYTEWVVCQYYRNDVGVDPHMFLLFLYLQLLLEQPDRKLSAVPHFYKGEQNAAPTTHQLKR